MFRLRERCYLCNKIVYKHQHVVVCSLDGNIFHGACRNFDRDTCFHIQSGSSGDWFCSRDIFPFFDSLSDMSNVTCLCKNCRLHRNSLQLDKDTLTFNPFQIDLDSDNNNNNIFDDSMSNVLSTAYNILNSCNYHSIQAISLQDIGSSLSTFYFHNIDGYKTNFHESLINIKSMNNLPSVIAFCETNLKLDDQYDYDITEYNAEHLYAIRTHHLIDSRQNGFLKNNSCEMNLNTLIESLSTNLLQDFPTDIIYFDFAKAFDTVNHDLILSKLKYQYSIDGRMLKFFKSYLSNRTQNVVIDNCTSDIVEVLSGVPQGSILGPLLFVLIINDIFDNIDKNSLIDLYADDTKLSRKIATSSDCDILRRDIDTLNNWCISNKMKFNADKCKVLTVAKSEPMFMNELPFCKYSYTLGDKILDYTACERDLGILINERLDWHEHHDYLLKKGYQMLGMTKRTCHFVFDRGKKRMLYLTLVRSNFEHCSTIWHPVNVVDIRKFKALQKRAIKWINCEEAYSYSDDVYEIRCWQTNILPLQLHFELNDLVLII